VALAGLVRPGGLVGGPGGPDQPGEPGEDRAQLASWLPFLSIFLFIFVCRYGGRLPS
jgi:hypothetical protein